MVWLKINLLKGWIGYILYNIVLLGVAYLFNRFVQMLLFILFFNTIQNCFGYRFHADTLFPKEPSKAIIWCKIITISIELIYMAFCNRINISIYSNLCIIFIIALLNALLEFYLQRAINSKEKLKDINLLTQMCDENHISEQVKKRMIMHFIECKTYQEIANIEVIDMLSVKQSIRRCIRKLNL